MPNMTRSHKHRPLDAIQHRTAGPYSPVLEVDARRIVVISGQVAVDMDGHVIGHTIEEQTEATLANCLRLLASADCTFSDVFKVNIYLKDLEHWERFNTVYGRMFPQPLPVRTAIAAVLLPGFLVEIEMWAAKAQD